MRSACALVALTITALPALAGCLAGPGLEGAADPSLWRAHDGTGREIALADALLGAGGLLETDLPSLALSRVADTGGEPNVGVTPAGAVLVTAGNAVYRSEDGGRSWTLAFDFAPLSNSDPWLWVDPATGRTFAPFMFPALACSSHVWSDDAGETWTHKPMTCGIPGVDHQKLVTGPYPAEALPRAGAAYPNAVYYCYNKGESTNCAVSYDGGLTYPVDAVVALGPRDGCAGINGPPAVAPDGTAYVPFIMTPIDPTRDDPLYNERGCGAPRVGVSTDGGMTWRVKIGPDTKGGEGLDPVMTVTPDGTAYYLYRGSDYLQYLVRSRDRFETWEGPWLVSRPDLTSTVFSGITSGDDGRLALAYVGTRDSTGDSSYAPDDARWHLYFSYAFTTGEGPPTILTTQATPEDDPVQVGCIWLHGGGNACRNLLDFIDLQRGPDGRAFVAFTDGCETACAGRPDARPEDSRATTTLVAYVERGLGLLAGQGPLEPPAALGRSATPTLPPEPRPR